jgi:putative glutamine amidotransferase
MAAAKTSSVPDGEIGRSSVGGPTSGPHPVIGVTPCLDAGRRLRPGSDYWYLNRNYTRALAQAGAAPVLLCPDTPIDACLEQCEGLVLSGGGDLPQSFNRLDFTGPGWMKGVPSEAESLERIAWERALLDAFANRGRHVLGVCFGMQLMNLHFGGTLLTDLAARPRPGLDHGTSSSTAPHAVEIAPDSTFFEGWQPPAAVSSSHRQAIMQVAPGFKAIAWAPDGVVEAIERGPLVGIEWHPESDASAAFVYGRLVARVLAER